MKATIKIYVNVNKKSSMNESYPIYLRITYNKQKAESRLNLNNISKKQLRSWNPKFSRFEKGMNNYNMVICDIQSKFDKLMVRMQMDGTDLAATEIRDELVVVHGKNTESVSEKVNWFLDKVIMVDTQLSPGTKRNYKKSFNHFNKFLTRMKYDKIIITKFKVKHASQFVDYLFSENIKEKKSALTRVSANSILKNVKPLFVRLCFDEKITKNPFSNVQIKFTHTKQPIIEEIDFFNIYSLKFEEKNKLNLDRDIFLFMCFTGLNYGDLYSIKRTDLKTIGNNLKVKSSRIKTGVLIEQLVVKLGVELLKKYESNIDVLANSYILPRKSSIDINRNLKIIGLMAGINFPLTTNVARRFFCQSILDSGTQSSLVANAMMGHSSASNIQSRYAGVKDALLIEAKDKLDEFLNNIVYGRK